MDRSSNEVWRQWGSFEPFETRAHRFRLEQLPLFFGYLGLTPESRVLDAGCGTGVFTRYLAQGLTSGHITGFDINEGAIAFGMRRVAELGLSDRVRLQVADGFELPYAEGSFDAVTNYTYLGVLSDPEAGLREMIRVTRPGGTLSCVVATNSIVPVHWQGDYPFDGAQELQRLADMESRIFVLYAQAPEVFRQSTQWAPLRTPKLFAALGLQRIGLHPFAHLLCYNDERLPLEQRRSLALAETREDLGWIEGRVQQKQSIYEAHGFGTEQLQRLLELMGRKLEYLEQHFEEDQSFEWMGGYNFIVTGLRPE